MHFPIRRIVTLWALAVIGVVANRSSAQPPPVKQSTEARPNILYFYVDDMGWGSIGPNGQNQRRQQGLPSVRTPHLDALARGGLNFTRGYGCHVCSPARSSQQSGFHQGHTFADRNDPDNAKKAMRADDVLIGDALSQAGYTTGYWGKWGYGGSKDQQNPVIENVQTLPTSHGYQYVLAELHHVRAHTFFQPTLWSAPVRRSVGGNRLDGGLELIANSMKVYQNHSAYPASPALQNHPDYPATGYCDDMYAFSALDFVREQGQVYRKTGKPFFGLLAVQIPHAPFKEIEQLPDWDKAYQDDPHFDSLSDQTRQWMAMVTRIDAHFGNILAALQDPNHDGDPSDSIAENTLVIFQSDNGGPAGRNNVELDANGGLRGNKGQIYEGGIRVPLIMRWPEKINDRSTLRAGTNVDRVVDVTDLLPTFCELAGASVPLGIDGVSIAPTLTGSGIQRPRDFVIHEAGRGKSSIIRGTTKLVYSEKAPPELYDLESDHAEKNNLASRHPERVNELTQLLLGERVTEPKGFAITYHDWINHPRAQRVSDADNWSDYEYANAGIRYMTDDGAPRSSWVARIKNPGEGPQHAVVDQDLSVLALEISGQSMAKQTVTVSNRIEGRNEIRVASGGVLDIEDGEVASLRWVDIQRGGTLRCNGVIDADVYQAGTFQTHGTRESQALVRGNYHQSDDGALEVLLGEGSQPLTVEGRVSIRGKVSVGLHGQFQLSAGKRYELIRGKHIEGRFANPEVPLGGGLRGRLEYEATRVVMVVE